MCGDKEAQCSANRVGKMKGKVIGKKNEYAMMIESNSRLLYLIFTLDHLLDHCHVESN